MLSEIEQVRKKLMNNASEEYDAVVSLGGSCASCLQIRKRELQTQAYPFDYVFCEDAQFQFHILGKLFATDFAHWLQRENIVPLAKNERGISDLYQYKDAYTGFRYIHDFKKPVEDDEMYQAFYEKYTRRLKRLYEKIENSKRILFVSDAVSRLKVADIKPLLGVLNKKWKHKTFDIAVLNFNAPQDEVIKEKHIKIVNIKRLKNNYDFFGMNYEWGEILDSVKLTEPADCDKKSFFKKIKEFFEKKEKFLDKDSVFFITGCSTGIGKSWCELLLEKGYKVVATARNASTVKHFQDAYPKNALCVALDVTDDSAVKEAVQRAVKHFGKIDVLVNNAGSGCFAPVETLDFTQAGKVFNVNVWGALNTMQEILPYMRRQNRGLIINTSSIAAYYGMPTAGIYAASKAALERLSEALKAELADFNIKILLLELGETQSHFYKNSAVAGQAPDGYNHITNALLVNFKNSVYYNPQSATEAIKYVINVLEENGAEVPFRLLVGNEADDFVQDKINILQKDIIANRKLSKKYRRDK